MIRPARCFIIGRSTACAQANAAVRFVARTASQSAGFIRTMSWSRAMPALLTRMSIRPWRSSGAADHGVDRGAIGDVHLGRLGPAARR